MFKKLVNNVTNNVKNIKNATNKPENEPTPVKPKSNQPSQPDPFDELPERPFEVDFEQIWDYEFEELQEFIQQYEQYSTSLRNKYNDMIGQFRMTKEKLVLLEQERKRLLIENEQYKTQTEQLKGFIDQQTTLQTQNSSDSPRSKTSSPKTKQAIQKTPSTHNIDQSDDELITALKSRVLKLVDELTKAEEPICVNVLGLMANFQQSNQSDYKEDDSHQVMNTEDYANGGSEGDSEGHGRALDTDNNEPLDSERVPEDNKGSKNQEQALREALKDSLGQALRRIGGEIRNISDAYVEALGQVKLREKELAATAQNEAKNEEYEQEIEELKGQLGGLKGELENKSKALEKARKAYEELSLNSQEERVRFGESLDQSQKEIQELQAVVDELKEEVENAERAQEDLELEREELQKQLDDKQKQFDNKQKQLEDIQRQLQDTQKIGAAKEKNEKDMGQDMQRMQQSMQAIEEEKKKLEKKVQQAETERLDKENALIQEKLKHHQTIADLTKMKEKFEEVEKHLNDEVEGRKVDIRKGDELKKRLVEFERKSKEYKKTIKKLSQQILDLHNNKNKKEEEEAVNSPPELTKGASEQEIQENVETEIAAVVTQQNDDKAEIINTQYTKIHKLEEKLEELHKEVQNLQANNGKLLTENKDLATQVRVLTEKRELGLKEIKKLTQMLDQARNGGSSPTLASSMTSISGQSQRETEKSTMKIQPILSSPHAMGSPEDLKKLRKIKKGLDSVYIDIIMAITNEKMHENSDNKATGKLGELVKGPLPSEGFMKIEKKMNDSIVSLQEYIENFE